MRPEWKMSEEGEAGPASVVATFATREGADRAVERLRREGIGSDRIRVDAPSDRLAALEGEARQEIDEAWAGPSIGLTTRAQTKWAAGGVVLGGMIGAVLVFVGFIPFPGLTLIPRLILCGAVGIGAGATIGLIVGGGWGPRIEREYVSGAQQGDTVSVTSFAPDDIAKARRILEGQRPVRLDEYGPKGEPRLGDVRPGEPPPATV
jgi:hypothetical protein